MKIAMLFKSYGPYHLARLRAARQRHEILAIEYTDLDDDYAWDVRNEKRALGVVTFSSNRAQRGEAATFAEALAHDLTRFAADAVAIPGYSEGFALAALRTSRKLRIPAILMSDTHDGTARRDAVRSNVKSRIISLYQSALVAGSPHASYLEKQGFPPQQIAMGYDVIDNDHFAPPTMNISVNADKAPKYFFCCARFIEKKNLEILIDAYSRYRDTAPADSWKLVIAGDGPLRDKLERQRLASSVAESIELVGHKSYDELPALYRSAGAFVFPSLFDEWGLVVNEAMAAGLTVIVSKCAGCSSDLVETGVNGYIFDPANVEALAALMRRVAADQAHVAMGRESRRIIARWGIARFADGLTAAAEMATRPSPKRRSALGAAFAAALSYRA